MKTPHFISWWFRPSRQETDPILLYRLKQDAYFYEAEGGNKVVISKEIYEEIKKELEQKGLT